MAGQKIAAVILAAGKGTRMRSNLPKVLHTVGGLPLVHYPVRHAQMLKAERTVVVVGHGADLVQNDLDAAFSSACVYAHQTEQRGTGHALMVGMEALKRFSGQVLVLSGDVPLLRLSTVKKLVRLAAKKGSAGSVLSMIPPDPTGYGRVIRNKRGQVTGIVEHKDCQPEQLEIKEVNAGIYCFSSNFLKRSLKRLGTDNAQGEYYLTDLIEIAEQVGQPMHGLVVKDPIEVLGANNRVQLAELEASLRARRCEELMESGVTIVDPDTTYIGVDVKVGRDTIIQPGVHLRGETKIGKACEIDTGSVITNGTLGDRVLVKPHTVIEDARLQADVQVGPFARIRPGAKLMKGSKVGNFVEIKKTTLGKGAKASHLSYLGDAEIGAGANIGAGTITCNYDGYGKHKTEIGDGVFVGSNSTLVAPLKIGKNSYVAAGSALTDEVTKDSLALGRARQTEKAGRAIQIRKRASDAAKAAKKSSKK
ncbi:MAG: bifunctional UDP-N-acetylglucosamine diphosphorylase/glucosamine-1-phosphate N-acetyltransferase GlmU [Myxococcota bacterium]|nr:bifunctional UDP-N-acetylglucosamine diphosphorylase/glucosamine-1-phosphate N-acetyltransferase GlmU [Myxococcota bacterium]